MSLDQWKIDNVRDSEYHAREGKGFMIQKGVKDMPLEKVTKKRTIADVEADLVAMIADRDLWERNAKSHLETIENMRNDLERERNANRAHYQTIVMLEKHNATLTLAIQGFANLGAPK